jgi:hypothetical protein
MKLLAYKINGQTINIDIFNWSTNQLNGNRPWIVSDTILSNYTDISSITTWYEIGLSVSDYLYVRERIREFYATIGFTNLTPEEQLIVSRLFISTKSERDQVMSNAEQQYCWDDLVNQSQECRVKRWESAKKYISYKLSPIDSSDLAKSSSLLCNYYINYNIITLFKDGISGLFDYLKGEGDYTTNGYPSKSYWSQQDQDKIMDILENGNY